MDIEGATALITGAGRRIGRAIALRLADQGADIVVHCNRSIDEARQLADKIQAVGRKASVVSADQSNWRAVRDASKKAWDEFGGIDILVNNASIFRRTPLSEVTEESWNRIIDINLKGPFAFARYLGPMMKERGRGKIINLTDIGAEHVWPGYIPYCISKAGVLALTRGLARALAPEVQANAVAPGAILWPEDASEEHKERVLRNVPLGRAGSPEDIARAVCFFIENDYVTGTCMPVDGGRSTL